MVTSAFSKFDFRPVISISGLQFYTYICYIQFWFIQFYWLWHRPLYRLPRPRLGQTLVFRASARASCAYARDEEGGASRRSRRPIKRAKQSKAPMPSWKGSGTNTFFYELPIPKSIWEFSEIYVQT